MIDAIHMNWGCIQSLQKRLMKALQIHRTRAMRTTKPTMVLLKKMLWVHLTCSLLSMGKAAHSQKEGETSEKKDI